MGGQLFGKRLGAAAISAHSQGRNIQSAGPGTHTLVLLPQQAAAQFHMIMQALLACYAASAACHQED
jgi:hypothetical protein